MLSQIPGAHDSEKKGFKREKEKQPMSQKNSEKQPVSQKDKEKGNENKHLNLSYGKGRDGRTIDIDNGDEFHLLGYE